MLTRIGFNVSGKNKEDIKRKAILVIADYLNSDDIEKVERETQLEVEVDAEVEDVELDSRSHPIVKNYTAKIWAKLK